MSSTVHAIYENGVFRPVEPVDLPDNTPVEFEPRVLNGGDAGSLAAMSEGLAKIYEILGRRSDLGRYGYRRTAQRASAMNRVFLDTVGIIAVWDDTDQWHAAAHAAYRALLAKGRRLVTTSFVLCECGNAAGGVLLNRRRELRSS